MKDFNVKHRELYLEELKEVLKNHTSGKNTGFEDWMNNQFAPWALTMVFATNFIVFMLILGQLAFGK